MEIAADFKSRSLLPGTYFKFLYKNPYFKFLLRTRFLKFLFKHPFKYGGELGVGFGVSRELSMWRPLTALCRLRPGKARSFGEAPLPGLRFRVFLEA